MTSNRIKIIASLIIVLFFIQGCTSVNTAQISQDNNNEFAQLLRSNNKILLTRIAIKDVKAANAGDLMRTNVVLHNRWHFTLDFSYQVRWYDKNDFEIDPGSHPWSPVVISGKDDITVQSTAPRASATQFKIYIKD